MVSQIVFGAAPFFIYFVHGLSPNHNGYVFDCRPFCKTSKFSYFCSVNLTGENQAGCVNRSTVKTVLQAILMHSIRVREIKKQQLINKCKEKRGRYDSERMLCVKIQEFANNTHLCKKEIILFDVILQGGDLDKRTEYLITVIGNAVSLAFLAVLFIAFILEKDLQTSYGKCVTCLSATLSLIHVCQLISLHASHIRSLCKAIAVLLHWGYFTMFLWMALISIDLYFTFTRLRPPSLNRQTRRFRLYLFFTIAVSALFIITCVVIDFGFSGSYVGYGIRNICFVASYWGNLFAFVVPVGLILIVITVLLCCTLLSIRRSQKNRSRLFSKGKRKGTNRKSGVKFVLMTLKLSTLLGLGWLFGFVGNLTDNVVILYMFVIITSCQGLFTFIAFCCNAKVLKIFRAKFKSLSPSTAPQTSQRTTRYSESEV